MTASSPRPAGTEPGVSECTASCGADADGGHWHSLDGYVWAQYPRRQVHPAVPDTTGGELREAIARYLHGLHNPDRFWHAEWADHTQDYAAADAVLALPALRDLLAERDTLAAQVQAVEWLAEVEAEEVAQYPTYEITVSVPKVAGQNVIDDIFDAVADAAHEAEPEDRDGWDILVAGRGHQGSIGLAALRRALGTPTTGGGE